MYYKYRYSMATFLTQHACTTNLHVFFVAATVRALVKASEESADIDKVVNPFIHHVTDATAVSSAVDFRRKLHLLAN